MEESIWYDNMKIKLVTSYNQKLFDQYAHRFEKTYNWPFEKVVYNEDEGMFDLIPDLKSFVERNKNRPINKHKGFLLDGVRFSYKVYAYTHAILNSNDYDGLIWIDSDSVFYEPIDAISGGFYDCLNRFFYDYIFKNKFNETNKASNTS